jgi:GNAT superfamily N-acetyltransferase
MRATYVDPRWSRRGLATLLARVTETVATNAGFTTFEAMCTPASEAVRLRLGYDVVERISTSFDNGPEIKIARMRKTL